MALLVFVGRVVGIDCKTEDEGFVRSSALDQRRRVQTLNDDVLCGYQLVRKSDNNSVSVNRVVEGWKEFERVLFGEVWRQVKSDK